MPSSFPWNPSPRAGRSLAELLEEQQEPFLLEVYLMENRCSMRMITSQSKPFDCCPLNLCKRLRIRLTSHGGIGAVFFKRTLAKFIYSSTATTEHRRLSFSTCFSEESNHLLSPVSVLQLNSAETNSVVNNAYITLEVVHENSKPKENKFSKGKMRTRPALDCVREAKGGIWSFHGISGSAELIKKTMNNELILSWERHKGDDNSLASDFSSWKEKRNQLKPPLVREIGLLIEAAIFDDLREEAVLDMFHLH